MKHATIASALALVLVPVPATAGADHVVFVDEHAIESAASEWVDGKAADRGGKLFVDAMMAAHNDLRGRLGVAALEWNAGLAADAAVYAAQIAQTRMFGHSKTAQGRADQGENLWMGTKSAYSYAEMTGSWTDEGKDYTPGQRFPKVSSTGSWHDVGHYTQMVWGATRSVGCAVASNQEDDFLVCRYFPAGNVNGEEPYGRSKTVLASLANASAR